MREHPPSRCVSLLLAARLGLALGLLMTLAPTSGAAAAQQSEPRLVLGYYVPDDPASWASLAEHVDHLDMVAAQWVSIDACANLASRDDQTLKRLAQQHHVKVLPSLLTLSG